MHSSRASALIAIAALAACASAGLQPDRRPLVTDVVESIVRTDYDRALRIADSLASLGDPAFMMLRLNALGVREMDFECVIDSAALTGVYRQVIAALNGIEAEEGESAYTVMLRGFAMAGMASYDLRRKEYGDAVRVGLDALRLLERAAEMDSTVSDPDYFLGLYDWSKADLRRRLWWVLFWLPGGRERGIQRMERCRASSLFASTASALSLVDVYVQEKRYAKADTLLGELQVRFPDSRFVLWAAARRREAGGDLAGAAAVYGRLADSYERERYGAGNAATCRMMQADLLEQTGEYEASGKACARVLEQCGPDSTMDACEDAQRLQRRLRRHD